jgi:hypothetical protein
LGAATKHYQFVQPNEGIIASTEPIPINVIGATGLNFLIDIGGGVRIKAGQQYTISVGYKFVHVSNGGTTGVNPGLDNNVFFARVFRSRALAEAMFRGRHSARKV